MITIRRSAFFINPMDAGVYKKMAIVFLALLFTGCMAGKKIPVDSAGQKTPVIEGAFVIGEVEPVTIKKIGLTMPARIDTGAQTSSLNAIDITRFERDGKPWVKFTVNDVKRGQSEEIKSKLVRIVEIKRHGAESVERPVVKLRAILGEVEQVREFSLADRSDFEYPVLIGRNFLSGSFVVDVSLKNSTSPMNEEKNNEK